MTGLGMHSMGWVRGVWAIDMTFMMLLFWFLVIAGLNSRSGGSRMIRTNGAIGSRPGDNLVMLWAV